MHAVTSGMRVLESSSHKYVLFSDKDHQHLDLTAGDKTIQKGDFQIDQTEFVQSVA